MNLSFKTYNSQKKLALLALVILAILLYQPVFGHLGTLPIRQWDEARLAQSALEMLNNGFSIIVNYGGEPDMWSTKPPLMIWAQSLSMSVFGPRELGLRFPSAMAALFTCILLILFSRKKFGSIWGGLIASLVLITTWGYIDEHGSRTGDYDALLTFFTTGYILSFYLFIKDGTTKYLYGFFIAFALGGLTKGVSAFLFLPALLFFSIYERKLLGLLKNKHFYFGLCIPLVIIGGYYLGREALNPGYLFAVWQNELGGRYLTALDMHDHELFWYLKKIFSSRFEYWFPFLLVALVFNRFLSNYKVKELNFYLSICALFYFLIISTAKTKLHWYDIPLYPLFAMTIGAFLFNLGKWFMAHPELGSSKRKLGLSIILFIIILLKPYHDIFAKTYHATEVEEDINFYKIGQYLQDCLDQKIDPGNKTIVHQGVYAAHIAYYTGLLNAGGKDVKLELNNLEKFGTGDTIILYQEGAKGYYWHNFDFEVIESYGNVETWVLKEPKLD